MALLNQQARFVLDHKGQKVACPSCGHKRFRLFIDRQTGNYMDPAVGICDRIYQCGYSYTALDWIKAGGKVDEQTVRRDIPPPIPRRSDWRCPEETWAATTGDLSGSNLFRALSSVIPADVVERTMRLYGVGTYPAGGRPEWQGAAIYWQKGLDGEARSGKIIQYDALGKRVKGLSGGDSMWMHTLITGRKMHEIGCSQVLFGTHLLEVYKGSDVCLVESEKAAVIMACFYPQYIWLATGGSSNISAELLMPAQGRKLYVFPDQGVYQKWEEVAIRVEPMFERVHVSDILEAMGLMDGEGIDDIFFPVDRGVDIFPAEPVVTQPKEEAKNFVPLPVERPVDRLLRLPGVAGLVAELDLDIENATILKYTSNEQDNRSPARP